MGDLLPGQSQATVDINGYKVTYRDARHTYTVVRPDGVTVRPPSASTITKAIDIGKTGKLMWWATGQAVDTMRSDLRKFIVDGKVDLPVELIEPLLEKARKAHNQKTEEAADLGREVHAQIQGWLERKDFPANPTHGLQVTALWFEEHRLISAAVECEKIIYNPAENYVGTFDALAWLSLHGKTGWWLLDFKTSNALRQEYDLQVAAYAVGSAIRFPDKELVGAAILKVPKTPEDGNEIEVRVLDEHTIGEAYDTFLAARRIYEWGYQR